MQTRIFPLLLGGMLLCALQSNAQWQLTGNGNASGTSLLGTTNGVPLRIGTNNQERIRVAIDGNVGINNTNPAGKLTVQGSGGVPIASWVSAGTPIFSGFGETTVGNSDFILSMASNTPLARGVFFGRRARGVLNAPLAVQPNDYLTSILASGYDGTNFLSPAAVDFFVDGPVSGGVVPGRISFSTGFSGGTRAERLRIFSNGNIDMNAALLFANNGNRFVGIGTSNPANTLHVFKGSAGAVTPYPVAPLIVENSSSSYVHILASNAGETGVLFGRPAESLGGGLIYSNPDLPGGFQFRTNGNVTRMVLTAAGRLGVGTQTPNSVIDAVSNTEFVIVQGFSNFIGLSDRIGVRGNSVNNPGYGFGGRFDGGWRGVLGVGAGGNYSGDARGVWGEASGTAGSRYGVYGSAFGGTFNAAGYFAGNVYANGILLTSDRKFKSDIKPMKDVMSSLMKLRSTTYEFKGDEYKHMNLPKGKQMGLIADEVKAVFPELVTASVQPAEYDKDRNKIKDEIKYDAVNYIGLIPVLIAAVQEQQQTISKQQEQIEQLMEKVNQLSSGRNGASLSSASLGLITPNPVRGTGRIQYEVPEGATNARMLITDALGRSIKVIQLSRSGTIDLDASSLASGVYNYSLVVDGKTITTKKMTVVR